MRALVLNAHSGPDSPAQRRAFTNYCGDHPWSTRFVCEAAFSNLAPAGWVAQGVGGSKGRRENAIITRAKADSFDLTQLTRDLGTRVAHDRWALRARYGNVTRFALHANAGIQDGRNGDYKDSPGARAWKYGFAVKWADMAAHEIGLGRYVQVAGDLNWNGTSPHPGSPAEVFAELGMHFVNRELMWYAWTPNWRLANFHPVQELPPPPGSDHNALSVRLRRV